MTFTTDIITKLESKGFKRWQKNGMDRMYINAYALGLKIEKYKTGNVAVAYLNGDRISNAEGTRLMNSKTYIDLNQSVIVSTSATLAHLAAELAEVEVEENNYWDKELVITGMVGECEDATEMTEQDYWNMVNHVTTPDEVHRAEMLLRDSNLDNDVWDELMIALSFQSREIYGAGRR